MRGALLLFLALSLVASCALAQWDDAKSRGLFPFWQTGGDWFTVLVFVNGSEETSDVIYVRFVTTHSWSSDTTTDRYGIRYREQLVFSTSPSVPLWIPTTASTGYIVSRVKDGGMIHPYCVVYNGLTGAGFAVPAYHQDHGF